MAQQYDFILETRLALDHSQTQWSQAPDVFVEKSQLELRAEREQAAVQNRALSGQQKSVRVDHSSFPTLGGAPAKPKAFWGVPGASIPKSKTAKGGKKKMVGMSVEIKSSFFKKL